ncbi:MAG: transglutaminase domain-containing protein, partial [Bacteroidales bacterium]|nr:transglutaminase domain-containing protein [Bacteroidales bacterium]
MKRIFIVAVLAAIVAAAYLGNRYFDRFITDKEYKLRTLAEYEKRMEIYNLSGQKMTVEIEKAIEGAQLQNREVEALKWLYASMPWSDVADYPVEFYVENVKLSFAAKEELPWGKCLPEREFRHFVLPVRVNNERLDRFRGVYYPELKARVKGMGMEQAALEVNHWCHEKATYLPSDSRTSSPMATILTATGRCGEESVLLVAALRCIGIPARQVYTPRWAHTDDNHAWVEAWIDGKWYFMGACEPEPVLNMAWFNEPASRAMLMHTKVFGDYVTDEDIISKNNCFTEINMIQNYVDTRRAVVKVVDGAGVPVEGADVEFKIYNYAEFYSVTTQKSNAQGEASLTTGLGDLLAWASCGNKFGFAKMCSDTAVVVLDRTLGDEFSVQIEVNPPAEGRIPVEVTQEQIERNKVRLAYEDSTRTAYTSTFYKDGAADDRIAQLLYDAKGNWREIEKFISGVRLDDAIAMLQSVSKKDLRDTPAEIFSAHLLNTPDYESVLAKWNAAGYNTKGEMDRDFYAQYLLNPRIAGEYLSAYRDELRCAGFPVEEIFNNPAVAVKAF